MLSVWCVLTGDKYQDEDVLILRAMVSRHLRQPFQFLCLSDRFIPGVDCLVPDEVWPGWWSKLLLFRYATTGLHLYLDLDCVVVGDLDPLVADKLTMPSNWAQSGHGGCQSSVMAWGGDYAYIPQMFDPEQLHPPSNGNCGAYGASKLWGDQEFITYLLGPPGAGNIAPMQGVCSYKYHCQRDGRPPERARVVAFHGVPKPADVEDEWVKSARLSTRVNCRTRFDLPERWPQGSSATG